MQITLNREELIKPLGVVAGVVERRQTLPILSNLLVRSNGKTVTFTGTDMEVEITAEIPCQGDTGQLTIPARKFYEICRALPADSKITLSIDKEKALVRSGKSRFKLLTMPENEFPSIEAADWQHKFQLPQNALKWLLEKTMFCMAQQDVRYYLNGLLIEVKGGTLKMVATDGHRLSLAEKELEDSGGKEYQVILPRKGAMEMASFLEDSEDQAQIAIGPNHIKANLKGYSFISKLIDGKFPDYSKVIPSNQSKNIIVDRSVFRETLGRVAILSNEKYRGVRFGITNNLMTITAHNPEQEEAQEEIAVEYKGDELEIGFNVNYISDALGAIEAGQIQFGLNDPNSSCLIRESDNSKYLYVVMPMRL